MRVAGREQRGGLLGRKQTRQAEEVFVLGRQVRRDRPTTVQYVRELRLRLERGELLIQTALGFPPFDGQLVQPVGIGGLDLDHVVALGLDVGRERQERPDRRQKYRRGLFR